MTEVNNVCSDTTSKTLVYCCDGIGSVFDSQVLELINSLSYLNFFCNVILLLGYRTKKGKDSIHKKKISNNITILTFRSYPNYPFFNFLIRNSLRKVLAIFRGNYDGLIFHTRGELISWHLAKIIDTKYHYQILPDIRGSSVEEIDEFYPFNRVLKYFKIYNYKQATKNLSQFYKISVISTSLQEHLIVTYGLLKKNIYVIPCLAGTLFRFNLQTRKKIRRKLNIADIDVLIVFSSGSIANWQNNRVIIDLAEKGFKILNLSKMKIEHNNILNFYIPYHEVPDYLNAADFGIVWRNNSIVNTVASPVKFSEYICCGLPVITNRSIAMVEKYIDANHCGIILDSLNEIQSDNLFKFKPLKRHQISNKAITIFGLDAILENYLSLYSTIIEHENSFCL